MEQKFQNALRMISRVYLINKGQFYHRINQFFIAVSILLITVIYAVNSERVERYETNTIWPFKITQLANEQLCLHYRPIENSRKLEFSQEIADNDFYHVVVIDQTSFYDRDELLEDNIQPADLQRLNESVASLTKNKSIESAANNHELIISEKIALYYLGKQSRIYSDRKFIGLNYLGNKNKLDTYESPGRFQNAVFSTFLRKKNGVKLETITDFASILSNIKVKINGRKETVPQRKVVLSIFSDFDHDLKLVSGEPNTTIAEVEKNLKALAQLDKIHQINLVKLPLTNPQFEERDVERSEELIRNFRRYFTNSFLFELDFNSFIQSDNSKVLDKLGELDFLLAPVPNYKDVPNYTIDYYYPFEYEVSHSAARGHLFLEEISEDQNYLVGLSSTDFRREGDLCLDYSESLTSLVDAYSDYSLGEQLCMDQVNKVRHGFFKSLVPHAERLQDVSDAHLIVYPLNPKPSKDVNYFSFKEKVKIRLFELLPHNDALLLGLFSITFLAGIYSYLAIFFLSVFGDKIRHFWPVLVIFLGLIMAIVAMFYFSFNNFILVTEESWRSWFLLLIPLGAPFSVFFWYAEKTKAT